MGWLHGVVPQSFNSPEEATCEGMQSVHFEEDDCKLLLTPVNRGAEELGWAADNTISVPTAARFNMLKDLVQSSSKRKGSRSQAAPGAILAASLFQELMAAACKKIDAK